MRRNEEYYDKKTEKDAYPHYYCGGDADYSQHYSGDRYHKSGALSGSVSDNRI
jgi:hypothetical protein